MCFTLAWLEQLIVWSALCRSNIGRDSRGCNYRWGRFRGTRCSDRILHRVSQFSTTLAESICASVFQGFVFGSMDTVETAAEG